jgi:paraquat-inducible protein A
MTTSAPSLGLSPLRRSLATIILLIATGCNVACLWIPFMTLTLGTSSTDYSVLTSAFMLWDSQLPILAILVIGFSIIFPFAKLSVLWSCVFWPQPSSWRIHLLELVERFGKWSMLDVFLVCILMALTSNQFFVGNAPLIGTPIFIIAIIFSMLAGEIISTGVSQPHSPAVEVTPPPIGLLLLLGFSAVLLGCVISMPFLIIDDWLLRDNAYSIISLVPTLIKNGSISMAVVAVAFLILIPIWSWLATVHLWIRMRRGQCLNALTARVNLLRRWSMLDVFGLALGVFLIEGKTMMTTEVSYGALLLVLGLGCQSLIHSAIDYRLARRHVRNESPTS